ncbi:hypothetical protein [Scytonema sp. NUACC26]|uniref:hypothetical protein n=1 Tax=Scytonema sp. NUACC26 TaxID=3140176 RepID=UPI0034DBB3F4
MKKSTVKSIAFAVSSLAAIAAAPQKASAELNVGPIGIPDGLEGYYAQYLFSGPAPSKAQSMTSCHVGFGASCSKAGAVLEQLIESNNGLSAHQLLMRAAGGEKNFEEFASYFGNKPELLQQIPYASFWRNDDPFIMDGHRYLLGYAASREPVQGLGEITKKFHWTPYQGNDGSLSPRNALLNLKLAFGRVLIEESNNVQNLEQKIQDSKDLEPKEKKYYLSRIADARDALKSGNEELLEQSLLQVLSMPYEGRNNLQLTNSETGNYLDGKTLLGEVVDYPVATLAPDIDVSAMSLPDIGVQDLSYLVEGNVVTGEAVKQGGFNPAYLLPLALLPILFGLGGDDDNSSTTPKYTPTPDVSQPPADVSQPSTNVNQPPVGTPPVGTPPVGTPPVGTPPVGTPPVGTPPDVKQVPEPSTVTPYVLLAIIMFVFTQKQWRIQAKG